MVFYSVKIFIPFHTRMCCSIQIGNNWLSVGCNGAGLCFPGWPISKLWKRQILQTRSGYGLPWYRGNGIECDVFEPSMVGRKSTTEGVRELLPHHIHCPWYIHRTGNLVQMYSWYFILEHSLTLNKRNDSTWLSWTFFMIVGIIFMVLFRKRNRILIEI